ncbi:ankyrin repeat-containing protein [Hibiscus syriacus]|uniref:Ankyrin repeat-containing protein n=1 Tax=Hibiscus syriacus TaxID=106335 RepID=A0A6A3CIV4_HIBSY|nr:ankyrin repeat-containing protein [Hibiscus syriacus]
MEDTTAVKKRTMELYMAKKRCSMNIRMLVDDSLAVKTLPLSIDQHNNGTISGGCNSQGWIGSMMGQILHMILISDWLAVFIGVDRKEKVQVSWNVLDLTLTVLSFNVTSVIIVHISRLRVIAELRHGDIFHSANIVSSIEFDRDDEMFAIAGVSRRIKVFELSSIVNEPADVHRPVNEPNAHERSCDYDGIITVWDITTRQSLMEYEEHEKRAWCIDFCRAEPSMLVSGSDDCKVKVWCMKQEASVLDINLNANVCSVKYNPGSSVNVGTADHQIHYYDLRNISKPLYVFGGHKKAVSYVNFLSNHELASASTDSTLRLWDVKENSLAISKPAAQYSFGSDMADADEEVGSYFISAVCWKSDSQTMLSANSQGTIKVLVLAA